MGIRIIEEVTGKKKIFDEKVETRELNSNKD